MYKCELCKKVSEPRDGVNKLVVATRPVTYYEKIKDDNGKWINGKMVGDGIETVKEVTLCKKCYEVNTKVEL